jgi:hypothetical protein
VSAGRDPSIRRRAALLLPVVAALLAATACARNVEDPAGEGRPSPSSRPPTRFATAGQVRLPQQAEGLPDRVLFGVAHLPLPIALSGTTAYVATHTALLAVDVRSGRTVATIASEHTAAPGDPRGAGWNPAAPPVLADRDGETTLVVPLLVTVAGGDPARSRTAVELIEVKPATNRRQRSVTVDVGAVPTEPAPDEQWLAVVGVVGTVAVLRVGRVTYGVDLALGAPVWQADGFTGSAVVGDVVVGWFAEGATQRAAGLRVADGARLWAHRVASTRLSVVTGGPAFAVLQGRAAASGKRFLHVVRATTGAAEPLPANVAAVVDRSSTSDSDALSCRYDGAATTVCGAFWDDWNSAFDAASGRWMWEVQTDTPRRTPIRLTAAWHGVAYGTEAGTRPVVLDARTGAVRESAAAAAPFLVNASVGVGPPVLGDGIYAFPVQHDG